MLSLFVIFHNSKYSSNLRKRFLAQNLDEACHSPQMEVYTFNFIAEIEPNEFDPNVNGMFSDLGNLFLEERDAFECLRYLKDISMGEMAEFLFDWTMTALGSHINNYNRVYLVNGKWEIQVDHYLPLEEVIDSLERVTTLI